MKRLLILPAKWLIRFYQICISPFIGSNCRFYPSCSSYALTALETHGIFKGSWLAIRRISRCHPWSEGGFDYVPGTEAFEKAQKDQLINRSHSDIKHSCSCGSNAHKKH